MAKVISRYLAIPSEYFTATNIKDRSSDVGDETVNGNNLDVTNITITNIKDALSESHFRLFDLWHSSNVNKYSKFGVYTRLVISQELQFITPISTSSALMGSFAGYNHDAIKPECDGVNWTDGGQYTETVCAGETATFSASHYIRLGEIDWYELDNDISYMHVKYTNSDLSVVYATGSDWTLNTTNFTKADGDFYVGDGKALSSTTTLVRTYYLTYYFYDSSDNELFHTGANERPNFRVTYSFRDYVVSTIEIHANSDFDAVGWTSKEFIVGSSSAVLTYEDFHLMEESSCVANEQFEIYLRYPDSTVWERDSCNNDHACSGEDLILYLDEDRVSCITPMRIKLWPYNILDCPATRPF